MLKAKINNIDKLKVFKKIMGAIAALLEDDGDFTITPTDGIILRDMEKSRFALIDLNIRPGFFEGNFQCDKEYAIAVNVKDFQKVLDRIQGDGSLEITLDQAHDALKFQTNGYVKKQFALPLTIGTEEKSLLEADDYEPTVNAKLRGSVLSELIKDVAIAGGNVKITADIDKLVFICLHDRKEVTIDLLKNLEELSGEAPVLDLDAPGYTESLYSIDMLKDIFKVDTEFAEVQLSFSLNQPLKLRYSTEDITLKYLLAPVLPESENIEKEEEENEE